MSRPKRPVASASAKPRNANGVTWAAGLRASELMSAEKMLPMPTPAPTSAMQARPAPIILAEARSMVVSFAFSGMLPKGGVGGRKTLVQVNGVVQVDAGEDGVDIGLQHRDQELEQDEAHVEDERQHAEDAERSDEAGEDEEHGVAGHHVGEEPDRQRARPD